MSRIGKQILFYVLLPLLIGYFIYFFFRPNYWFVQILDIREPLISLKGLTLNERLLIFSGSDFCWAFSFSSALFLWEAYHYKRLSYLPLLIFIILVGSEFIQQLLKSSFTLDWWDVIAAMLAFWLSMVMIRKKYEKK